MKLKKLNTEQSTFLDFVRGLAALLVLFAHAQQIMINPYWYPHKVLDDNIFRLLYSHIGAFGVMLFFVLSGFLIFFSMRNNILNGGTNSFDVKRFARSRLNRLWPPLIISLVLAASIYFLLAILGLTEAENFSTGQEMYLARKSVQFNSVDMFGSLFFLNTIIPAVHSPSINGPLWSLAHELWFYVIAGLCLASFYRKTWCLLLIPAALFLYFNANIFWFYGFISWCFGGYSAWCFINYEKRQVKVINYLALLISASLWVYMLVQAFDNSFYNFRQKFMFGILIASLLPIVLTKINILTWLIKRPLYNAISSVSKYAYTLYLLHFPIFIFAFVMVNKIADGNILLMMVFALLTAIFTLKLSKSIGLNIENRRLF
jgi:peptidoglycan/LPS O-acetylase OafA/YrhL